MLLIRIFDHCIIILNSTLKSVLRWLMMRTDEEGMARMLTDNVRDAEPDAAR